MPDNPPTDRLCRLLLDSSVTFDQFFKETTTWDLANLLEDIIITQNMPLFNLVLKLFDNQASLVNLANKKYSNAWLDEIYF